ncbi:hypothetical protein EFB45_18485 [Escherichia coli]|nr:membrane protein [Escherichia coli]OZP09405.1 hypothetical protein CG692_03605 [Escherichia coli]POH47820.1 hypothetical protein C2U36_02650 [Escherichia coli]RXJ62370.1 hypothetical protein EFB45_18485 [Escherichia coli]
MHLNDFFYNRLFILNFCLFFRGLLFLTKAQPGKKATFFFLSPFATTLLAVASWHSVNAMYIAAKKMMK